MRRSRADLGDRGQGSGARKTAMGTDHLSAAKRSRRGDKWPVPVASSVSNEKETSETSETAEKAP